MTRQTTRAADIAVCDEPPNFLVRLSPGSKPCAPWPFSVALTRKETYLFFKPRIHR